VLIRFAGSTPSFLGAFIRLSRCARDGACPGPASVAVITQAIYLLIRTAFRSVIAATIGCGRVKTGKRTGVAIIGVPAGRAAGCFR
jgi:hypothetical protein